MCTVSWQLSEGNYALFFNRDERRTRAEAEAPAHHLCVSSGTSWLAPLDPPGGGTWIFVNDFGLCAAVLNHYRDTAPALDTHAISYRSRGRLLEELAPAKDVHAFIEELGSALRRAVYRSCLLLALDPVNGPVLHRWTGAELDRLPIARPFITTSSFRTKIIEDERVETYRRHVASPRTPRFEELDHLHRWHDPRNGARSILMARPDARTVSRTDVAVGPAEVEMSYRRVCENPAPTLDPAVVYRLARRGTPIEAPLK